MEPIDVSIFRDYPTGHPFRVMLENGYDSNNKPKLTSEAIPSINAMRSLCWALSVLRDVSPSAFNSFIEDKLVARKGKDEVDLHNLLSALCELSVMNAFILASDEKESFIYEPRLVDGSRKNVEFSIRNLGRLYNVEVKSANLPKQKEVFLSAMDKNGIVVEPNARILPLERWKEIVGEGSSLLGSLDNKVADFLENAQDKFPPVVGDNVHLLIICWDGTYRKALTALKSNVNGLMTGKTYKPELKYDHISHVLVTTVYGLLWDWVYGRVQGMVSMDPLNLRFAFNFIIDYNLVSPADIYERLKGILGVRELPVVDESYVSKNCEDALYSFEVGCLPRVNSEI